MADFVAEVAEGSGLVCRLFASEGSVAATPWRRAFHQPATRGASWSAAPFPSLAASIWY